jgi:nuclear pore complex protein Nup155
MLTSGSGAIKLALAVAQQLDRGNKALSWMKDERPAHDAREDYYKKRTFCYDLVFRVIDAVDQAYSRQSSVPDGIVSAITRRRIEAYEQINDSSDEVFQNYLYDWYLQRNQST